jgi:hypothetical protein
MRVCLLVRVCVCVCVFVCPCVCVCVCVCVYVRLLRKEKSALPALMVEQYELLCYSNAVAILAQGTSRAIAVMQAFFFGSSVW